ncbi:hypothetical protein A5761_11325 [Mycolicibacterium setense]|uniref:hypothetical protein n=1 Tax=Mycolicibacterium setense TaxID=431269 RepID=UPI0007EA7B6A|nr:hypothetical protein [Mycolicibacterium setense]OBB17036.1 hypothetical protein A5761_11325 [Mycolicibacterium setense]
MTLSQEAAETIVAERHSSAAGVLGIGERTARPLLDEAALDDLAEHLVASFADEAPGADLFSLPRSASISIAAFGRLIAGLGESIQFFELHPASTDAERASRMILEAGQLLAVAGLVQSDHTSGPVSAPPALLSRIGRFLATVAELTDNPDLSAALRRDAMRARSAATGSA